ncbi:hypothetical protein BaSUMV_gp1 [Banana streak UM virus]|uniref:Uncharacterized protein n=1 Tax=Banana streak UM virus TaxID=1016857 RepID=F5AY25_9VIRU|nr:hypothetical protein BaSUMV_gp1 [Banana streak UM virus]AEC49882.1 hypothetical protein [Banana streak UM virus]
MTSEQEWEQKFAAWKDSHTGLEAEKSLITGSKIKNSDLNHNIRITCYRSDLGYKVLLTSQEKARAHRSELFSLLREHNLAHNKNLKEVAAKAEEALKISRAQRSEIKNLKAKLDVISDELQALRKDYLERRPLNKKDVEQLVLQITEQPKFIEKQTEALLEDVSKLVVSVRQEVNTVQHMLKVMRGE